MNTSLQGDFEICTGVSLRSDHSVELSFLEKYELEANIIIIITLFILACK